MTDFVLAVGRMLRILVVVGRHAVMHAASRLVANAPMALRRRMPLVSGPCRFRSALEDLGGSFIKFGQMLALQPDVLSLEYCNVLFDLLDRVPAFDYAQVEHLFVADLGRPPTEVFDRFDRRPIASASIGQVHVAYLGGAKYAVKVQRPEARAAFTADMRLMALTGSLIRTLRIRRLYWMLEPIGEFIAWTHEELDYTTEQRYLEQLRRNAEDNPYERVPAVLRGLTTGRILVTEFLDGVTVLGHLRDLQNGDDVTTRRRLPRGFVPEQFAQHIVDNFLRDVFRFGLFHADLHPANLMILPDNTVGYIDFGITGAISEYSRENLVSLTLAYTRGDVEGMADAFFTLSVIGLLEGPERFRAGLRALAADWYDREDGRPRLRKNFTLVMLDMLRLSHQTGVWPERDVIKYIRSAIAIDGLITRFAPSFDVGAYLRHVCAQHLRWHARRKLLRAETAVECFAAAARLMQTGPARADAMLDRFNAHSMRGGMRDPPAGSHEPTRVDALLLTAAAALVAAASSSISAADLQSAIAALELLLTGIIAARLLNVLWRLVSVSPRA